MLVLTRKPSESLVIDGRIIVTVVEVRNGRVRLAIEAPGEVPVHRQEVFERMKQSEGENATWHDAALCAVHA